MVVTDDRSQGIQWLQGLVLCLLTACGLGHAATEEGPRVLLAGGALSVCSSLTPDHCVRGRVPSGGQRPRYTLDLAGLKRIEQGFWEPHRTAARDAVLLGLRQHLKAKGPLTFATDSEAVLTSGNAALADAWDALASYEQLRILESLQQQTESETISLADTRAEGGRAVYLEFVAMARAVSGRERPRLLISTASSRDPYAAIRFYQAVFTEAGAEVRWLPLDHALQAAQAEPKRDCDRLDYLRAERWGAQDRAHLYPDAAAALRAACLNPKSLIGLLEWADGVFLNGGDQSLMRAAWHDANGSASGLLQRLLARLQKGRIVIGGTSAGAAVQTSLGAPMLVSGDPAARDAAHPLRQLIPDPDCAQADSCAGVDPNALWFHPDGGLGSFDIGVVDTHFSARGREYRLARLLQDTGSTLGVGVDETTGLRLDRTPSGWRAKVIGRGAATWIVRLDTKTVLVRRQTAATPIAWPIQLGAQACPSVTTGTVQVAVGTSELGQAIQRIAGNQVIALQWRSPEPSGKLGRVCVGAEPGDRIWEFVE